MYHKEYLKGNNYIINLIKRNGIEEKFINFVYQESLIRPLLWLIFTEDILCNTKITYTINTTSIISTYLVKKEDCYYLFETLKTLLRLSAIKKIIYKKEFIIIHYYNEFIKNILTVKDKWLNLTIGEILKENKIIDNVYYSSIYNDYNVKKEIEVLLVHDEKIIILNTNLNNVIENEGFLNIYITISNLMKRISIPHIKFNYIKKKFINNFLSYIN